MTRTKKVYAGYEKHLQAELSTRFAGTCGFRSITLCFGCRCRVRCQSRRGSRKPGTLSGQEQEETQRSEAFCKPVHACLSSTHLVWVPRSPRMRKPHIPVQVDKRLQTAKQQYRTNGSGQTDGNTTCTFPARRPGRSETDQKPGWLLTPVPGPTDVYVLDPVASATMSVGSCVRTSCGYWRGD